MNFDNKDPQDLEIIPEYPEAINRALETILRLQDSR